MSKPKDWPHVSSAPGPDVLVAKVRFDMLVNPRTGQTLKRTVLETPDWANVVALTPSNELVLVQQFRFGPRHVTLEVPGGVIDPGEDPEVAARRELREETGYTSDDWTHLGSVEPNPAFHDNRCHHYLARGCRRTHELEQDPGEDLQVLTLPLEEAVRRVHTGEIDHSLVICALARVVDLSRE